MDIKKAVKIVEQMENDVESLCKCCMPAGTCCFGCREMAITTVLNELKKKDEIIEKAVEYIKNNKNKTYAPYGDNEDEDFEIALLEEDITNLLQILEDKEVE